MVELGQRLLRDVGPVRTAYQCKQPNKGVTQQNYQPWYLHDPVYRPSLEIEHNEPSETFYRPKSSYQASVTQSSPPSITVIGQGGTSFNLILIILFALAAVVIVGIVMYQLSCISAALAMLVTKMMAKE